VRFFEEIVNDADAIYFATLEEAKVIRDAPHREWPFIEGRFEIRRTLMGTTGSGKMILQTGLGGGDCGVPMTVSRTFIIFKKADLQAIHDCDGSRGIYGFEEDEIIAKVEAAMKKKSLKNKAK
jgi:hypothetical protein